MSFFFRGQPAAVSFTGGIDSSVLAYWLAANARKKDLPLLHLLVADYGQANFYKSWELAQLHAHKIYNKYRIQTSAQKISVCIPGWSKVGGLFEANFKPPYDSPKDFDYSEQKKTYDYALVDGRNAFIYITMFSSCCNIKVPTIYTGHQLEPVEWENIDSYRHRTEDFTPMFLDRMNLLQECGFSFRVRLEAPFIVSRMAKIDICRLGISYGVNLRDETYSCQFYPECKICDNCRNRERTFASLEI